jgi:hypothetical protein
MKDAGSIAADNGFIQRVAQRAQRARKDSIFSQKAERLLFAARVALRLDMAAGSVEKIEHSSAIFPKLV